jgi:hypothetical protein
MTYPVDTGSSLSVIPIAAIGLPGGNISESLVSAGVDPRVQETEDGFAGAETSIIEECDDGGGDLFEVSKSLTIIR